MSNEIKLPLDLKPGDKILVEATIDVPPDENGIAQVNVLLDDDCKTLCIDDHQLRPWPTEQSNGPQSKDDFAPWCPECKVYVNDESVDGERHGTCRGRLEWCELARTEPLSDDLRIVVVTRAERGFTADVYGDFNSYGAAKKWAEANLAKKIGYDLKPVTVIAIQSEESIPMPQRDMIEAILRAKDHCAYKLDADRLQWAAEFISKQRPTIQAKAPVNKRREMIEAALDAFIAVDENQPEAAALAMEEALEAAFRIGNIGWGPTNG